MITARERAWWPSTSKLRPSTHVSWHELHDDQSVRWQSPRAETLSYIIQDTTSNHLQNMDGVMSMVNSRIIDTFLEDIASNKHCVHSAFLTKTTSDITGIVYFWVANFVKCHYISDQNLVASARRVQFGHGGIFPNNIITSKIFPNQHKNAALITMSVFGYRSCWKTLQDKSCCFYSLQVSRFVYFRGASNF